MASPFITLDKIVVKAGAVTLLHESSWQINHGQHWVIIGPNGAGKSTLAKALWGGTRIVSGKVHYHQKNFSKKKIGYVSFELHQNIISQETREEEFRHFANKMEEKTLAKDIIAARNAKLLNAVAAKMEIKFLLTRSITALSTGEMRKVLIARALVKNPKLLILDEPFDGLDVDSRKSLKRSISALMSKDISIILVVHHLEEILPEITNVLFVKNGRIFLQGTKSQILTPKNLKLLYKNHSAKDTDKKMPASKPLAPAKTSGKSLIKMKNVTVKYGKTKALNNFSWEMKDGENWCILGPNGSGKSTIVKLITAENVQGYANHVEIFGQKLGSHESIWALKKEIGIVSSEFQIQYRKNMTAFDVICSGFYDSIGLYRRPTEEQKKLTEKWLKSLQISALKDWNFEHLSYGQKRMVLLARAMIKSPKLLILDEPCHGLDLKNKNKILKVVKAISQTSTNLLYITHHEEEILPTITHFLKL